MDKLKGLAPELRLIKLTVVLYLVNAMWDCEGKREGGSDYKTKGKEGVSGIN